MPDIHITVRDKIAIGDRSRIVCGNSDYIAIFDFDAEWDPYDTKTARFVYAEHSGQYVDVVFTGTECPVPVLRDVIGVTVGVFAGDLHTTTPAWFECDKSILCGVGSPSDPPDDVYNQIMELIHGLGTPDEKTIAAAVAEYILAHPIQESDPTVPDWAKEEKKPSYTAADVGADPSGTAASHVSAHNTGTDTHSDIRLLLQGLTERLNALADSDDTTLDQLSEIVAYIKDNRGLIAAVTTDKVSVGDLVNDLVTNVANKPLSAAQGVALKALVDSLSEEKADLNTVPNAASVEGTTLKMQRKTTDGESTTTEDLFEVKLPAGGGAGTVTSVNGNTPDESGNVEVEVGQPTDEQISTAVSTYLDAHPEATTTLQDGAVTTPKLADDVVTERKSNLWIKTRTLNLLDEDAGAPGLLSLTDGTVADDAEYYVSDYIPVEPSTEYKYSGSYYKFYICEYDENKEFIVSKNGSLPRNFTTSETTKYVRVNYKYGGNQMFALYSTYPDEYVPYCIITLDTDKLAALKDLTLAEAIAMFAKQSVWLEQIPGIDGATTWNLLNYEDVELGYIRSDGAIITTGIYANYVTTGYVAVAPGTVYSKKCDSAHTMMCAEYDADKKFLVYHQYNDNEFTTTDTTAFIRATAANIETFRTGAIYQGESASMPNVEPYIKARLDWRFAVPYEIVESKLKGKVWNILGDSWTEPENAYHSYIAAKTGIVVNNYGITSSTISEINGGSNPMCVRYTEMSDDADIITVFGGINDGGTATEDAFPLGDIDSTDTSTYYGAWNVLLSGLREKYPTQHIFVITNVDADPSKRSNAMLKADATIKVCRKHSIPCFDLYGNLGFTYEKLYDGLHLNTKSHETAIAPKILAFMEQFFM